MKTLVITSALVLTGLTAMSMGFPTNVTDGNEPARKADLACRPQPVAQVADLPTVQPVFFLEETEEAPVQLATPVSGNLSSITVKVFDVTGKLVMKQVVSMDEFLSQRKTILPASSTFVMFHQNVAYYFQEAGASL